MYSLIDKRKIFVYNISRKGGFIMNERKYDGISVVVPIYNSEEYLSRCIDSILNQKYKNIEIVCVNDGSTDGSKKILDEYAKKDIRIKVIHKQNAGVSTARNIGIKESSMPIIAFVDSDDYIQDDMYEKMITLMREENLDCVCCDYKNVYSDRIVNKNSRFINQILYGKEIREKIVRGIIGFFDTNNDCLTSVCNRLFVKDILVQNNIQFDKNRNYGEDWLFCIEYYRVINSIGFINENLYSYVNQKDSLSTRARTDYFEYVVKNNILFNAMFPEFEWDCSAKVKHYNNRPFEAANYYKNRFPKEKSLELIKEIFYISKANNYYKNARELTKNQQKLKVALQNDDVKTFVKVLQKNSVTNRLTSKLKKTIKRIKCRW